MGPQDGAPEEPTAEPQPEQKSMEPTNNLDDLNLVTSQPLETQHEQLEHAIALDVNGVWKRSSPVYYKAHVLSKSSKQVKNFKEPKKMEPKPMMQSNEPKVNGISPGTSQASSSREGPMKEFIQTDTNREDDSATEPADNKKIIDILVSNVIKKLSRLSKFFESKPTPDVNRVERLDKIFNNLYEDLVDRGIEGKLAPEQRARITEEANLDDPMIKIELSQAKREFGNFNDPMNPEEQKAYKIIHEMDFGALTYDMPEETLNLVRDQLLDIVYQTITSKDLKPILCSNAKKRLACRLGYKVKKLNEKWVETCAKNAVPMEAQVESSEQRNDFGDLTEPELEKEPTNELEQQIGTEMDLELEPEPVAESPNAMELNRPFLPLGDIQMVLNQAPSMPDINPPESFETIQKEALEEIIPDFVDKLLKVISLPDDSFSVEAVKERYHMIYVELYKVLVGIGLSGTLSQEDMAKITEKTGVRDVKIQAELNKIRNEMDSLEDEPRSAEDSEIMEIINELEFEKPTCDMPEEEFQNVRIKSLKSIYQAIVSKNLEPILCSQTKKMVARWLGYRLSDLDVVWNRMSVEDRAPQRDDVGESDEPAPQEAIEPMQYDDEPDPVPRIRQTKSTILTEVEAEISKLTQDREDLPPDLIKERHRMVIQTTFEKLIRNGYDGSVERREVTRWLWRLKTYNAQTELKTLSEEWKRVTEEQLDPKNKTVAETIYEMTMSCPGLLYLPHEEFQEARKELLARISEEISKQGCTINPYQKSRLYHLLGFIHDQPPIFEGPPKQQESHSSNVPDHELVDQNAEDFDKDTDKIKGLFNRSLKKKLTRSDVTTESRYALVKLHRESFTLPIKAVKERHQMILQLACETLIENGCKIKILHWNVHFHLYHLKKTYPALMREFHTLRDKWEEESAKPKDPKNEIVAQIIHGILHDCRKLLLRPPQKFESGRDELLERVSKQIAERGCELHSFQKKRLYRLLGLLPEEFPVVVEGEEVVDDDYDKPTGGEVDLENPEPREQGLEVAKEPQDSRPTNVPYFEPEHEYDSDNDYCEVLEDSFDGSEAGDSVGPEKLQNSKEPRSDGAMESQQPGSSSVFDFTPYRGLDSDDDRLEEVSVREVDRNEWPGPIGPRQPNPEKTKLKASEKKNNSTIISKLVITAIQEAKKIPEDLSIVVRHERVIMVYRRLFEGLLAQNIPITMAQGHLSSGEAEKTLGTKDHVLEELKKLEDEKDRLEDDDYPPSGEKFDKVQETLEELKASLGNIDISMGVKEFDTKREEYLEKIYDAMTKNEIEEPWLWSQHRRFVLAWLGYWPGQMKYCYETIEERKKPKEKPIEVEQVERIQRQRPQQEPSPVNPAIESPAIPLDVRDPSPPKHGRRTLSKMRYMEDTMADRVPAPKIRPQQSQPAPKRRIPLTVRDKRLMEEAGIAVSVRPTEEPIHEPPPNQIVHPEIEPVDVAPIAPAQNDRAVEDEHPVAPPPEKRSRNDRHEAEEPERPPQQNDQDPDDDPNGAGPPDNIDEVDEEPAHIREKRIFQTALAFAKERHGYRCQFPPWPKDRDTFFKNFCEQYWLMGVREWVDLCNDDALDVERVLLSRDDEIFYGLRDAFAEVKKEKERLEREADNH